MTRIGWDQAVDPAKINNFYAWSIPLIYGPQQLATHMHCCIGNVHLDLLAFEPFCTPTASNKLVECDIASLFASSASLRLLVWSLIKRLVQTLHTILIFLHTDEWRQNISSFVEVVGSPTKVGILRTKTTFKCMGDYGSSKAEKGETNFRVV